MANPNRQQKPSIQRTLQDMVGWSFDNEYKVVAFENLEYDGTSLKRKQADNMATRIDDTADPVVYIGKAPIGTATSSAAWQVVKLDTTSGLVKTWADGNDSFDNIWDNRASLTYS